MSNDRNRSWRRFQTFLKDRAKGSPVSKEWKPEKNWKLLYTRSDKLRRAKLLGNEYPRKTINQVLEIND